jgi:hypothetical protein
MLMGEYPNFRFAIVGFGPAGLSVLDQLLSSGVSPHDIAIIGMKESIEINRGHSELGREPTRDPILRAWELKAFGIEKKGVDTTSLKGPTESLASYWGASHLPPVFLGSEYDPFFPRSNIEKAIASNSKMLQIHEVKQEKFVEELPTCGEMMSTIPRKEIASIWAGNAECNFIHSRLSIGGHRQSIIGCSSLGTCFQNCSSGAFWSPQRELEYLLQDNPDVSVFFGKVSEIDSRKKLVLLEDSFSIPFEKLFLCAGPRNSIDILRVSNMISADVNFRYSPVIMYPFLVSKVSQDDYRESHVLADLLLPSIEERRIQSLAQIYFPTENLAANVFSKLPSVFLCMLSLLPIRARDHISRKIGIAMCFLEDVPSGISRKAILKPLKRPFCELKRQMKFVNARLIHVIKVLALDGSSHHTGSIFSTLEPNSRGLNSDAFIRLKQQGIYLADGLALIRIPPGPHTNTVCVISRCLVMEAVNP